MPSITTMAALPVGISFFSFQSIGYLVDVYRRTIPAERDFFTYALFISFFPQLVAGPIVRYADIEKQLNKREHTFEKVSLGIRRFIIGLSKKIILGKKPTVAKMKISLYMQHN